MVPTEGVEPTHPYGYQILSLARLPIPPRRHWNAKYISPPAKVNQFWRVVRLPPGAGEISFASPGGLPACLTGFTGRMPAVLEVQKSHGVLQKIAVNLAGASGYL